MKEKHQDGHKQSTNFWREAFMIGKKGDDTGFGIGASNKEYGKNVPNACRCMRKNSINGLSIFWYCLLTVTTYKNLRSFFPFFLVFEQADQRRDAK